MQSNVTLTARMSEAPTMCVSRIAKFRDGSHVSIAMPGCNHVTFAVYKCDPTIAEGDVLLHETTLRNVKAHDGDSLLICEVQLPVADRIGFSFVENPTVRALLSQPQLDVLRDVVAPYLFNKYFPVQTEDLLCVPHASGNVLLKINTISSGGNSAQGATLTNRTLYHPEPDPIRLDAVVATQITFSDIGGLGATLKKIRDIVELPLLQPDLYPTVGIKPPRGILLYGPPGSGKTMIARAIAGAVNASFHLINGPEIMSGTTGAAEERLRSVFSEAAKRAPAIIFIDEVDSIAPDREKSGEVERRTVAQLLTLMDGMSPLGQVSIIAATNRPNALDPALRRFGRFDREFDIGVPDEAGRLEILRKKTSQMKTQDIDLYEIARNSHGFVGADLASVCTEAGMLCITRYMQQRSEGGDIHLNVTMDDFRAALAKTSPASLRQLRVEIPKVSWSDIGGMHAIKQELIEIVEYPSKYPDLFASLEVQPPRGVLLYGPSGCGKTMIAKAIANESKLNFISVKGPQLLSSYFGESEANIRDLFNRARNAAPCIIFFDEIDSIGQTRGTATRHDGGATDRIINQLLTEMDGFSASANIFFVGATNLPSSIDTALLRPGRLDRLVFVDLPDEPSRAEILKHGLGSAHADIARRIAQETKGYSGADLMAIAQGAKMIALRSAIQRRQDGDHAAAALLTDDHVRESKLHRTPSVTDRDMEKYKNFMEERRTSGD